MSVTLFNAYEDTPARIQELSLLLGAIRETLRTRFSSRAAECFTVIKPKPTKVFIYTHPKLHSFFREATKLFDMHQTTSPAADAKRAVDMCCTQENHSVMDFFRGRALDRLEEEVLPTQEEVLKRYTQPQDTAPEKKAETE